MSNYKMIPLSFTHLLATNHYVSMCNLITCVLKKTQYQLHGTVTVMPIPAMSASVNMILNAVITQLNYLDDLTVLLALFKISNCNHPRLMSEPFFIF